MLRSWVAPQCLSDRAQLYPPFGKTHIIRQNPRIQWHGLAEYHVPVNADIHDIEVVFVHEDDDVANPIGVKGIGEVGLLGVAAAVANAVYHATGKRVRDMPITIDKLL